MARRSGLGRGLGALLPADMSEGTGDSLFREIDLAQIVPNRFQPRVNFDEEALVTLAASIAEIGVIQPIVVREITEGYEIAAGERRWRASQRAGLTKIPALVKATDDRETLEHAVVENIHRQDLNALEEAAAYRQLIDDFGLTQAEVATRVGRSRSTVANTIRLMHLPAAIQGMIMQGNLSAGHGRALLAVEDDNTRQALAEKIVSDNLSVREVERRVAKLQDLASKSSGRAVESAGQSAETQAGLLELEELLATRLNTRVSVRMGQGRGKITIQFADLDDLERIYTVISVPEAKA